MAALIAAPVSQLLTTSSSAPCTCPPTGGTAGPAGPAGPIGPQGPPGATGPAGVSTGVYATRFNMGAGSTTAAVGSSTLASLYINVTAANDTLIIQVSSLLACPALAHAVISLVVQVNSVGLFNNTQGDNLALNNPAVGTTLPTNYSRVFQTGPLQPNLYQVSFILNSVQLSGGQPVYTGNHLPGMSSVLGDTLLVMASHG